MAELRHIIEDQKLEYQGLVSVRDLYRMMEKWFAERRYSKQEKRNYEEVNEGYKCIDLEIEPQKKVSDYIKISLKVEIMADDVKDVDIDMDGRKETVQEGKFHITFNGYVIMDYENKWEMKPFYFFIRTVMDKFVYKGIIHRYEKMIAQHVEELAEEMKAFLNITKYKHGQ